MYELKADLNRLIELETEELKAREQEVATGKEDLETMRNRTKTNRLWFAGHRGPEWLRRAIAEKERADKAEALVNELRSDSKTDDAVMEGQAKRIEELESLVRELAETLRLYEQWEAELITDNSLWQSASGLPFITQEVWDELVAVQTERNKVLHKAKEHLDNG